MKEKIINYIETLEAKAYQSDDYFKQRNDLYIENQNKDKEIERLHSIIKEVREYIEEKYNYILGDDTFLDHDERIERKQIDHILEILDNEEVKLKKVKEK